MADGDPGGLRPTWRLCRHRVLGMGDSGDDRRRRVLDAAEGRGQHLGLAVVELDVVARGRAGAQADGLADDEGDGFGLGFADSLRGRAALADWT